jgi:hypothetical protein
VAETLGVRGHDLSKDELPDIEAFVAANALRMRMQDALGELIL